MSVPVTDFRSNSNDQIAHAVKVLGRSKDRLAVFREIHRGKKKIKTASEIAKGTGLKRKRVLEEGVKLAHKQIVIQTERNGEVAYQRDNQFYAHREEVIAQVKSPTRRNNFPTKYLAESHGPNCANRIQTPDSDGDPDSRAHRLFWPSQAREDGCVRVDDS